MESNYVIVAEKALDKLLRFDMDFADVRLVELKGLRIEVVDGRVREVRFMSERGLALRCLVAGKWGFTSTSLLTPTEVERACARAYKLAKSASKGAEEKVVPHYKSTRYSSSVAPIEDPSSVSVEEKLKLCSEMEKAMREASNNIKSTSVTYVELEEGACVINSLGLRADYEVPSILISATAYASEAGVVQRGYESHGGTGGLEVLKTRDPMDIAQKASKEALELLRAKGPPAGRFTCILDPELTGVFIHEAFGHACEADAVLQGNSILEGMIGKRVGSEEVVVKDDPTLKGLFGYVPIDSEGVSGSGTTIVDRGVLRSYLHNLETSARMDVNPTGNARAQGYGSIPIVRMTNTFIDKGGWKVEELFQGIKKGVYAQGSVYGYVDTAKGEFVFKCSKIHIIEDGELKQLCRDASLSGFTLDVLMNVEAVADDLSFKPGFCGKEGQYVRVTTGAPHVRVKDVVVGGLE
jgi:TldD protein